MGFPGFFVSLRDCLGLQAVGLLAWGVICTCVYFNMGFESFIFMYLLRGKYRRKDHSIQFNYYT